MKQTLTIKEIRERYQPTRKNEPLNHQPFFWLSPYITKLLFKTRITPNQVSLFWIILATLGFILIAFGHYSLAILGVIIYHVAQIFDYVDGELARAKNKKTIGGMYLDDLAQVLHRSLFLLVVGIGLYNSGSHILYLYLALITSLIFMFDSSMRTKVREILLEKNLLEKLQKKKIKEDKKKRRFLDSFLFLIRPAEPFNLLFIFLILNFSLGLKLLIVFYSFLIPLLFIKNFYGIYKKRGNVKE